MILKWAKTVQKQLLGCSPGVATLQKVWVAASHWRQQGFSRDLRIQYMYDNVYKLSWSSTSMYLDHWLAHVGIFLGLMGLIHSAEVCKDCCRKYSWHHLKSQPVLQLGPEHLQHQTCKGI